jgi:tRNA uridine 5-carbamoylmethylation protein Kti12
MIWWRDYDGHSIVIVDFINHIKGFRYEMYTRAKALGTQSCVVS